MYAEIGLVCARVLRDRLIPTIDMEARGRLRSRRVVVVYSTLSRERSGRNMTPPELRVNTLLGRNEQLSNDIVLESFYAS